MRPFQEYDNINEPRRRRPRAAVVVAAREKPAAQRARALLANLFLLACAWAVANVLWTLTP